MPYLKYNLSILPVNTGYESFCGWRQTSLIFSTATRTATRTVGSSWQVVLCEHLSRERRERVFRLSLVLFAPRVLRRSRSGSWCSYPSGGSSGSFSDPAAPSTAAVSCLIISSVFSRCLTLSWSAALARKLNSWCRLWSLALRVCWIRLFSASITSNGYLINLMSLMNRL